MSIQEGGKNKLMAKKFNRFEPEKTLTLKDKIIFVFPLEKNLFFMLSNYFRAYLYQV